MACDVANKLAIWQENMPRLAIAAFGTLNKQIAGELGRAEKTVKVHRGRMMHKLGVTSVAELVKLVQKAGIASAAEHKTKV